MELKVLNQDGTQGSKIKVDDAVFGIEPNESVVHQAVLSELANSRQGTHASRNRALIHGGGRKPWRQKGRGVARAGSTRSPIWRGGATTFGPQPHGYSYKLPHKVKQLARRSVLSDKVSADSIVVVESLQMDEPRTKTFIKLLEDLNIQDKKITVLASAIEDNLYLATRNLANVFVCQAGHASALDLIDCEVLLADKAGIAVLNDQLMA